MLPVLRFNFASPPKDADAPDYGPLVLHPLVGGPVAEAWKSVHLLADKVLPALH